MWPHAGTVPQKSCSTGCTTTRQVPLASGAPGAQARGVGGKRVKLQKCDLALGDPHSKIGFPRVISAHVVSLASSSPSQHGHRGVHWAGCCPASRSAWGWAG